MKKLLALALFSLLAGAIRISAQNNVGIGTANPVPSALLDLEDAGRGLLVPQLTTAERTAIVNPANGLIVYDKTVNCVYFYALGSGWQSLCGTGGSAGVTGPTGPAGGAGAVGATGPTGPDWTVSALTLNPSGTLTLTTSSPQTITTTAGAWLTTGNAGTVAPTNFIGTTDNIDWVMKTNSVERARILSNGQFAVNNTTPAATDVLSAYAGTATGTITAAAGTNAIAGYAGGATSGAALDPQVAGAAITGTAVLGRVNTQNYTGVYGENSANLVNNLDLSYGVFGAVTGTNSTTNTTFAIGVAGVGNNANSTGVLGSSNGQGIITSAGGSGGAFVSDLVGVFSDATSASGIGIIGTGNGLGGYSVPNVGAGIAGTGSAYGVAGFATTAVNTNGGPGTTGSTNTLGANAAAGGYFEVDNAAVIVGWTYVAAQGNTGTFQKIIGSGTVNTIVKDMGDKLVALSCPEAPENFFQDFGKGTLVSGKVHVTLDPVFSKNIAVNDKHDLRVIVQLEGDCNGVYVTNKTATGFDVVELAGGKSNVAFTYMVTANRADEVLGDGSLAEYSAERFAPAPGPQASTKGKIIKASPAKGKPTNLLTK